jgi:hypothetical protein
MKLWSLRSTLWTFVLSALAVVGFNGFGAYEDYLHWDGFSAAAHADFSKYAMLDAFSNISCLGLMLAIGAIGANVVVGEYSSGLIRTTFVAVPARGSVMAAKLLVVTAVTTVFGVAVAAASFALTQAILSGQDAGLSITHPGALLGMAASALMAPLSALVGMAVGVIVRHSVATMVTFVFVFLVFPLATSDNNYVAALIAHTTPYHAWLRLMDIDFGHVSYPWSTPGAWTVYVVWALCAAATTVITVRRRDH